MSNAGAKIKEEFLKLLPPTLYFFVALHIVAFVHVLIARGSMISPQTTISVGVAALILGKAVLLADMLPAINRYPGKPLAYNIAWKTVIYTVVAGLIHYLERLFDFYRHADGLRAANARLLSQIIWPHFWAVQIILFIMVLGYCTVRELGRVLGREKMLQIFFGPLDAAGALGPGRNSS